MTVKRIKSADEIEREMLDGPWDYRGPKDAMGRLDDVEEGTRFLCITDGAYYRRGGDQWVPEGGQQ